MGWYLSRTQSRKRLQGSVGPAAHMRDGTPSTIAPTPLQCDSPKVVTRKMVPKVDMGRDSVSARAQAARVHEESGRRPRDRKAVLRDVSFSEELGDPACMENLGLRTSGP